MHRALRRSASTVWRRALGAHPVRSVRSLQQSETPRKRRWVGSVRPAQDARRTGAGATKSRSCRRMDTPSSQLACRPRRAGTRRGSKADQGPGVGNGVWISLDHPALRRFAFRRPGTGGRWHQPVRRQVACLRLSTSSAADGRDGSAALFQSHASRTGISTRRENQAPHGPSARGGGC